MYFSVPFCRSKCTYCNFASGVYPASEHARYVDRLLEDIARAPEWAVRTGAELPRLADTVYLGGGTPSLLAPELIRKLFAVLRAHFSLAPDAEITVECAPGQLPQPTLEALSEAGVNRVSLGVQSFVDSEAHSSGRLHSRAAVLDDLRRLRAAGIQNLNLDLIAGLAGQTFASWNESLAVLCDTGVPHASVYMLEVDEDSRLGRELLSGGARYRAGLVPSDDAIVRMYMAAIERLAAAGLVQYEISNFADPGFESRHNLRYWRRRPYLGIGLDASSMLAEATGSRVLRATTHDELKGYLDGAEPEMEWLDLAHQHEEAWFLGLRLNAGVDPAELAAEFGAGPV
ncbi:MAG TPA: radical SAM family heme chaperone HemW, partial [Terracidiphilus sp.]|nr:radical SAM family heme chaperone HemW [Terracidiphilus sp.]